MSLENLEKISKLKAEPPDAREIGYMINAAVRKLQDSCNSGVSFDGRFELAYSAAHSLALAALRLHGYRSDQRYIVFQCLAHTVGIDAVKVREFGNYHRKRNLAEYEGGFDPDEQLLAELILNTQLLMRKVMALVKKQ
ncbi:MAG: hypothetical protein LBF16_06245 [Pseudomonadales bacterium]|jgi:hypothetical protein|nr:hypothetical protein [Pseudomonadales bacterium]